MGCVSSSIVSSESLAIDAQIRQDQKKLIIRLLLLGTGDSGKSTLLRQMKVLHTSGFHTIERQKFAELLKLNTLDAIKTLVRITKLENFRVSKNLEKALKRVEDSETLDLNLAEDIIALWQDKAIQKAWRLKNKYHVPSTAPYCFQHAMRIASPMFIATDDDIFRAKMKTTGIVEAMFEKDGACFNFIDVGGQRTERRKWIHCFENVTSVIYLVALDSFDMRLVEDNITNRMEDALENFKETTTLDYFSRTSWILFLNKSDLFEEKLVRDRGHVALQQLFPDYSGGANLTAGLNFFNQKFKDVFSAGTRTLYVHTTCAIDTKNIERVFKNVSNTILHANLAQNFF